MKLIHFPRSLTAFARLGLALIMLALALLGSARPAAAASVNASPAGSGFNISGVGSGQILFYGLLQPSINSSGTVIWPSGSGVKNMFGNGSTILFLGGLRPNTTYYWSLGNSYGTLGKTLQRRVDISFNSITVTNDSDSTGAGELYYFFKVNGVYHSELDFFRSTSATVTFNPNRSISAIFNGNASMPLAVELVDDDCTFSTCVPTPTFSRYGDNGDFEWATGAGSIDFSSMNSNYVQKTVSYSANEFVMAFSGTALVTVWYY